MSDWSAEDLNGIERIEMFLMLAYPSWCDIEIDTEKDRPDTLDRLLEAFNEFWDAFSEFSVEMELINEETR